ncbi:MAG: zinc metalloprotease [Nocardioidaceae bacterium]
MTRLRRTTLAIVGASVLALSIQSSPAQAMRTPDGAKVACFEPASMGARTAGADRPADHRDVSPREQRAIEKRTKAILDRQGVTAGEAAATGGSVPVYVHVMAAKDGSGDVSNQQIADQIAVLNKTFGGQELVGTAANTGFTFTLAGTDRYYNSNWHADRQSTTYRAKTRLGGASALNIWLVDFKYLGIATFPWDYAANPKIDGIRVHFDSLPGGSIANYNLGETATHEAGHWFGLYHTFQGGCTATNDEVADTPAQGSATNGCPEGRDSCALAGLDPIHNYMDYSYDSCYNQFTTNQSSRASSMFTAYRS